MKDQNKEFINHETHELHEGRARHSVRAVFGFNKESMKP